MVPSLVGAVVGGAAASLAPAVLGSVWLLPCGSGPGGVASGRCWFLSCALVLGPVTVLGPGVMGASPGGALLALAFFSSRLSLMSASSGF